MDFIKDFLTPEILQLVVGLIVIGFGLNRKFSKAGDDMTTLIALVLKAKSSESEGGSKITDKERVEILESAKNAKDAIMALKEKEE